MPVLATILMGIAGQAAWKIVNHFYERMTGKASAPAQPAQSFERSLSDASARATSTAAAPASAPGGAMLASTAFPTFVPGTMTAGAPTIKSAADAYRGIQHVEAP